MKDNFVIILQTDYNFSKKHVVNCCNFLKDVKLSTLEYCRVVENHGLIKRECCYLVYNIL